MEVDAKAPTPTPRGTEAVVRFTTKLPEKYQVPDDDLVVPASLRRYGLSEVINKLLDFDAPVPFDFIIDGEFLRTSLAQYLEARKLSSEKALQVEYVLAITEPEQEKVDEAPDWIADVAPLGAVPTPWFAAVGCDGTLRIYEGTSSKLVTSVTSAPLTALATLPTKGAGADSLLLMASKDGAARCAVVRSPAAGPVRIGRISTLHAPGGRQAAQAVAISEDGTLLSAAGWSNDVQVWNADAALFAEPSETSESAGSKRKAGAVDIAEAPRAAKFTLKGHSQVVSCMQFGRRAQFPFTLLSGSWDSSVRVWDVAAASCVCNWTVARAVTSLSVCPDAPRMATAHEDGHVSLWDVRAPAHPSVQGAVSLDVTAGLPLSSAQLPHRRLVSRVAWNPEDSTRLASVAHDGQLSILDPRSPKMPLQSLQLGPKGPCPVKILCVCWLDRDTVALGGSDGKVSRVTVAGAKATPADVA